MGRPSGGVTAGEALGLGPGAPGSGGRDAEIHEFSASCSVDLGGPETQSQGWGDPNSRPAQVMAQEIEGRSPRPWEEQGPEWDDRICREAEGLVGEPGQRRISEMRRTSVVGPDPIS